MHPSFAANPEEMLSAGLVKIGEAALARHLADLGGDIGLRQGRDSKTGGCA
jgi:hypothetical protein